VVVGFSVLGSGFCVMKLCYCFVVSGRAHREYTERSSHEYLTWRKGNGMLYRRILRGMKVFDLLDGCSGRVERRGYVGQVAVRVEVLMEDCSANGQTVQHPSLDTGKCRGL